LRQTRAALIAIVLIALGATPLKAKANSFGDAVLTVGISSAVGAVLGLSTLPFYENSGDHTRNIWIGAAVGAVIGVGFSAVSALKSTDPTELEEDYEEADKQDFSFLAPSKTRAPESVALAGKNEALRQDLVLAYAPIKVLSF